MISVAPNPIGRGGGGGGSGHMERTPPAVSLKCRTVFHPLLPDVVLLSFTALHLSVCYWLGSLFSIIINISSVSTMCY